jgi:hypothetical protein
LELLIFRAFDNVVHTWDLATALAVESRLDEDLVALTYEGIGPYLEFYRSIGALADAPNELANNASLQSRLLNLCGRTG